MDVPLQPTLRIQIHETQRLTREEALAKLEAFLPEYQERALSQGGDTTTRVQLDKLGKALDEEVRGETKGHEKQKSSG